MSTYDFGSLLNLGLTLPRNISEMDKMVYANEQDGLSHDDVERLIDLKCKAIAAYKRSELAKYFILAFVGTGLFFMMFLSFRQEFGTCRHFLVSARPGQGLTNEILAPPARILHTKALFSSVSSGLGFGTIGVIIPSCRTTVLITD